MIDKKLNELEKLNEEMVKLRAEKKSRIDDLLTDEMKNKLDRIDEYYQSAFDNLQSIINYLEHGIEVAVKESAKGVKVAK